jgi:PAS domain S-box-containing protein
MGEDDFRALVENAPDAIVVSRNGIVLYANGAAAHLLGYDDVSELVGKPMTFLDRNSVEVMRRRIEQMAVTGERLVPRDYPARRRDGTEITAEIASTMIAFEGAPAVLAYARDVTERTRLRAQLVHADRLASLGRMAAGVAHEINNPLAFVTLAIDLLSRRALPTDAALVDEVKGGLARIASIVRDLRFFGRDDDDPAGPVDLAAAIDSAEHLVAHELRPRGTLVKEYGELPPVLGVTRHIEQVFVNLFLNAAHALDEKGDGHVVVRAVVTPEKVVVSVIDDGCGIPKEILDAIFEPFFTTRSVGGGTGLGLSISRDMVVRSGGDLAARSTVGEGTTMEVTLPRAGAAHVAAPSPPRAPPIVTEASAPALRVLIVDDEPLIVRALGAMLADRATVVGETSAELALERIATEPPFDAILCDVMMPGMTGVDLHERVARDKPGMEARFVFVTGGTYTARARDYLAKIPNARLAKPFDVARIVEEIERVARR